ncbi:MAG: RcgR family putative quorum lactone hydrolase, partial [Pyrinomonadaceae bacterium]
MLGRIIHAQERRHARRDTNRLVRPFEWGVNFIRAHSNGDDPRHVLSRHAEEAVRRSDEFYALPPVADYRLDGGRLVWTSAVETPSAENNTARARFFPAHENRRGGRGRRGARRAVVVLPQWNADAESHAELCRLLARMGVAALRVTLPYHEERRPPEIERADHLVSSNIGRTLQSMRQAVLDTRAAVRWLREHEGYDRVGVVGTSVGSCIGFLAFVHDASIAVGVFNHVSGYVADVAWRGISTQHVRRGFGDAVTLDELRQYWLPISPLAYAGRLPRLPARPMRFIAARYDLTFPRDLSRAVIAKVKQLGVPVDVAWLPCGHYTSGQRPW